MSKDGYVLSFTTESGEGFKNIVYSTQSRRMLTAYYKM